MNENSIDTTIWERSSGENWYSPTSDSLQMLVNLEHDYIVSDVEFANYTLSSDITVLQGDDDGVGVVFDYVDNNNYRYIMYQGGGLGNSIFLDLDGKKCSVALIEVKNGTHKTIALNSYSPFWSVNTTFNIRLENLFDDIFFYVNNNLLLKYKKENSMSGKIGFVTYSQIADFENIQIEEPLLNRAKTKYKLYAVGNSDTLVEIEASVGINSDMETSIIPRAYKETDINVEVMSKYRGYLDALVEIQPIGHLNLLAEIEVRPHNRLMAIYEVQQPPIVTTIFNPSQDAFTREKKEFESINYGGNSSMVAGINGDDIWRSFVQFDLSPINPSYILTESHLRLYYKGAIPSTLELEVFNANEAWLEYSITNLNRPAPIKLITSNFTVNKDYGYIEFDVFDVVEDWLAQRIINNGFIIRASNETQNGQAIFHTKEGMFPPELSIKYFDSRIFSQGRSQLLTEIFIMNKDSSSVYAMIQPSSVFTKNDLETEIYCHQIDVPLDSDCFAEITPSIPFLESEITASIRKESDIPTIIDSRLPSENTQYVEITVNRSEVDIEVFSKYNNSTEAEIVPRPLGESNLPKEITINKPCVFAEMLVKISKDQDIYSEITVSRSFSYVDLTVPRYDESEKLVDIEINNVFISKVLVEIAVSNESIKTEITPRVKDAQNIYLIINVTKTKHEAIIEVRQRSDVWAEIEPNIKSDTFVEIASNKPYILAEISVYGYENSDIETTIDTKVFSQLKAEIFSKYRSEIATEIDANSVSQILVEITSNKPSVNAQVVIPTWVDTDVPTIIQPRIFMVHNINTIISVGVQGGAYAFIM